MKNTIKPVLLAILSAYATQHIAFADEQKALELEKVEVISTTPLKGIGLPLEQVPAAVQLVKDKDLHNQQSTNIADYMNNNLLGVTVNETQNNPFQPDILFRGFTASPLLGTPQGLSIFVDGVRVNEPFGDAVNWDLIPVNAIAGMSLIPGSNPVFGLNTLGGALSIVTKNGRTHQGGAIESSFGSWGRKNTAAEFGGVSADNSVDYFISGNYFDEDGWRDYSPTEVKQIFGKVGWQNEKTRLELSYTGAENNMIGNGLIQKELIEEFGRETINTKPDQTKNTMSFLNLNGSHWFTDDVQLSGNVYFRQSNRKTLNGDVNDGFDLEDLDAELGLAAGTSTLADALALCATPGVDEDEAAFACSGALNRSRTQQKGYGFNSQLSFSQPLFGKPNQLITGLGYDVSQIKFRQSTEFGLVNTSRGVDGLGVDSDEAAVKLNGKTRTWGAFATDTLSLNEFWHLNLSGRYNRVEVENRDRLISDTSNPESLSGTHVFNRFNPAVGLTFTPVKSLTVYGSYNEGMRAPTSMELGCANPAQPCKLPNAMAGDPPLKKVVAKTVEFGGRGQLTSDLNWSTSVYRTVNHDDIQFISSSSTGEGFFDNVGKTRRMGFDSALSGQFNKLSWSAGYSYVRATYESDFQLVNEVNTSSNGDFITVKKGDKLANIPEHALKLRLQYQATPSWTIGTSINTFSDVYVRGNENNAHVSGVGANQAGDEAVAGSGKIGGYTIVNLDTRYTFGNSGWQAFAKMINIFDKEYATGGMLGENWIENGVFSGVEEPSKLVMVGAPRAGWFGLRYEFGGKKSIANYDVD